MNKMKSYSLNNLLDFNVLPNILLESNKLNKMCRNQTPIDSMDNIDGDEYETLTQPIDIVKSFNLYEQSNSIHSNSIPLSDSHNLNYSVYIDNKYPEKSSFDKPIYLKSNEKWVDSKIVLQCQNCHTFFSFLVRKV